MATHLVLSWNRSRQMLLEKPDVTVGASASKPQRSLLACFERFKTEK